MCVNIYMYVVVPHMILCLLFITCFVRKRGCYKVVYKLKETSTRFIIVRHFVVHGLIVGILMVAIAFASFSCSILLPLKSWVLQGNLLIHFKNGSVQTKYFCSNLHFVILVLRRRHC